MVLWRAKDLGVREIARRLGVSAVVGLASAAPKRGDTRRQLGLSGNDCTMARGACGAAPESREADDEPGTAVICGEPAGRCGRGGVSQHHPSRGSR